MRLNTEVTLAEAEFIVKVLEEPLIAGGGITGGILAARKRIAARYLELKAQPHCMNFWRAALQARAEWLQERLSDRA